MGIISHSDSRTESRAIDKLPAAAVSGILGRISPDDRYLQERKEEDELFIQQATEFTGTLSQYPALGSAPHERVFLEAASESIRRCRDELRQVSAIYKTLGLKTNCHLHRVLGYKSQEHKSELQGV